MRHSTVVYTLACIFIGLDSASILYAGFVERIEIRTEAWKRLSKVSGLTPEQRGRIQLKINQTSLDDLKKPLWSQHFVDGLGLTSAKREEFRKDLFTLQTDEILKGRVELPYDEFPYDESGNDSAQKEGEEHGHHRPEHHHQDEYHGERKLSGTLYVRFVAQTMPTDQPSIMHIYFTGRCVSPKGSFGLKTFSRSVGVETVTMENLCPGIWEVSASANGVALADSKRCCVPGAVIIW
jgi:hypothetical protein